MCTYIYIYIFHPGSMIDTGFHAQDHRTGNRKEISDDIQQTNMQYCGFARHIVIIHAQKHGSKSSIIRDRPHILASLHTHTQTLTRGPRTACTCLPVFPPGPPSSSNPLSPCYLNVSCYCESGQIHVSFMHVLILYVFDQLVYIIAGKIVLWSIYITIPLASTPFHHPIFLVLIAVLRS